MAAASGYLDSGIASANYTIQIPVASAPVFSPAAGTYTSPQSVTITDSTPGATIYYTTDGTTPSSLSNKYTGAISIGASETIEAMAMVAGDINSAVASATYTINSPPTFTLSAAPGSITVDPGSQGTVTITVTPQHGFNSPVQFTCSGLPSGTGCVFSPSTLTPSGNGPMTSQLIISTNTRASAEFRNSGVFLAPLAFAACIPVLNRRRRLGGLFLAVITFIYLGAMTACGGGGGKSQTPVTSAVTVTATSGSIQQSASVALTVN